MMRIGLIAVGMAFFAMRVWAGDPAIGLWQTPPDRKDLISHIEVRECGGDLCGRIKVAFDSSGQQVVTPNIGKELFWDMSPIGDGSYAGGTVWVPLLNVRAQATMRLAGDQLHVRACKALVCDGQVWARVR